MSWLRSELLRGKVRRDMYSLGITLYELLSGRTPFEGSVSQIMAQHITQPPPLLVEVCPNLAPEISELVDSMPAKDPKARPSDMNRFVPGVAALERRVDA